MAKKKVRKPGRPHDPVHRRIFTHRRTIEGGSQVGDAARNGDAKEISMPRFSQPLIILALLVSSPGAAEVRVGRALAFPPLDTATLPTMTVDGVGCTLHDAILAANTATTVGGCTGSPGLEVLSLEADIVLAAQDATHSTRVGGAFAALPEVTSSIVLVAGAGSVVARAPALGCEGEDAQSFRLFNVTATGALYLVGLTLRNGCVAPEAGVESEGGALHVDGGLLELVEVRLEGNVVVATANLAPGAVGGAVFCREGTLPRVFDTTFDGNLARGSARAGARGGAVRAEGCVLGDWSDVVFTGNSALGGAASTSDIRGGALSLVSSSVGSLRETSFLDNLAEGLDGAQTGAWAAGGALDLEDGSVSEIVSPTAWGRRTTASTSRCAASSRWAATWSKRAGTVPFSGPATRPTPRATRTSSATGGA
jgi:hypothetical protein